MLQNGKSVILQNREGIMIIIPIEKQWFQIIFTIIFLPIWFLLFNSTGMVSFDVDKIFAADFNALIGVLILISLIPMLFNILWMLAGKEKIKIYSNILVVEKSLLGIGTKAELQVNEIKNLRVEIPTVEDSLFGNQRSFTEKFKLGKIKLDYGLKTYQFGLGVDEAEANYLKDIIKKYISNEEIIS